MDDLPSPHGCPPSPASWVARLDQLEACVADLRGQVACLQRENCELRQQAGFWKSMHAATKVRLEAAQADVEQLEGEKRKLQSDLFGRKSEQTRAGDRLNDLEDPEEVSPHRKRGQQPDRPGPKRRDYSHLPVREEWVEIEESERRCPCCGVATTACGTEDSEQIEIETVVYRRMIHRRRYRRTCACPGPTTQTALPPPKLIPKSRFGTSLWVEILLDKFASHRPTERLLTHWQHLGLPVAAGTVGEGLRRLAPLFQGVYEAICERNRTATLVQADETRWRVFVAHDGKTGYVWWLWIFCGPDTTVYVLDAFRSHATPDAHFGEDAEGVLMVDRYSAYKALPQVKAGRLVLAFCWAHVRRDFVKVGRGWPELNAWALVWLRHIRTLYRLNAQRLQPTADPATTVELRAAIAAMRAQAEAELADPKQRMPVHKVLTSLIAHWDGLTRFVDDPRIPLDNNLSERRLRGAALGRKNYSGSGAEWSGELTATLFTILATLQMWRINPRLWLTWFLNDAAKAGGQAPKDLPRFLPWNLAPDKLAELRGERPVAPPDSS